MDAVPVTLGQEFGGYAAQIEHGVERLRDACRASAELPLGGTAVGTGHQRAGRDSPRRDRELLATRPGCLLTEARDHFEAQGARDAAVEASGALRTVAVSLSKIANDLRGWAPGPRGGLGEIRSPTSSRAARSCRAR